MSTTPITSVLVPIDPDDGDTRAAQTALEVAVDLAYRASTAGERASGAARTAGERASGAARTAGERASGAGAPGQVGVTLVAVDPGSAPDVDAHGYLAALAAGPAGGPAVATRIDVATRSVATHLAEAPTEGEIVCMATHGRTRLGALVLGSVADAVIRRATAPVLLVGPHHETGDLGRPVVAAVDGSERDGSVVTTAAGLARSLGAELELTTVVTAPSEPSRWAVADGVLAAAADQAADLGVRATVAPVASGDPVEGLLKAADGAGCLVLGSRRRSAVQAVVSGTVHDLVRRSPVPVLVAP